MLAAHSLGLDDGAHFPAGILGIEVVEQVADRGKITVAMFGIHAVVHGDESHIHAGEYDLCVVSNLQIVPAEAAHVLHYCYAACSRKNAHDLRARGDGDDAGGFG